MKMFVCFVFGVAIIISLAACDMAVNAVLDEISEIDTEDEIIFCAPCVGPSQDESDISEIPDIEPEDGGVPATTTDVLLD